MKKIIALILVGIFTLSLASTALAHGGGLDQNGGHWDHRTGTYHKHR